MFSVSAILLSVAILSTTYAAMPADLVGSWTRTETSYDGESDLNSLEIS